MPKGVSINIYMSKEMMGALRTEAVRRYHKGETKYVKVAPLIREYISAGLGSGLKTNPDDLAKELERLAKRVKKL